MLQALPDIPRWLEARSALLSEEGRIAGFRPTPPTAVIWRPDNRVLSVVGNPDAGDFARALREKNRLEVLAPPESGDHLAPLLPGWSRSLAILHLLGPGRLLPDLRHEVRLMAFEEIRSVASLPEQTRRDLEEALGKVSTTWMEGRPVSFCYVAAESESLWDISIETLPDYRRRGAAVACTVTLIQRMREMGKEPVWGALESNRASLELAAKIGFQQVDRIWVFEKS